MGVRSYLTVGLLFGLTLPGVSAHGFLGGRGEGGGGATGLYSFTIKPCQPERERELTRRERDERNKEVAADAAEDRTVETQTDKEERIKKSVGDADPDS